MEVNTLIAVILAQVIITFGAFYLFRRKKEEVIDQEAVLDKLKSLVERIGSAKQGTTMTVYDRSQNDWDKYIAEDLPAVEDEMINNHFIPHCKEQLAQYNHEWNGPTYEQVKTWLYGPNPRHTSMADIVYGNHQGDLRIVCEKCGTMVIYSDESDSFVNYRSHLLLSEDIPSSCDEIIMDEALR